MIILVFSDSHRDCTEMKRVLAKTAGRISAVVHLGDGWTDIHNLMPAYPHIPLYAVAGNCDMEPGPAMLVFHFQGRKILVTHGHQQHVKTDYQRISYLAEENEADVCLFGHTHEPVIFYAGPTLMLNPGSISLPKGGRPRSYGVIDIAESGVIEARIAGRQKDGSYRPVSLNGAF